MQKAIYNNLTNITITNTITRKYPLIVRHVAFAVKTKHFIEKSFFNCKTTSMQGLMWDTTDGKVLFPHMNQRSQKAKLSFDTRKLLICRGI